MDPLTSSGLVTGIGDWHLHYPARALLYDIRRQESVRQAGREVERERVKW